MTRSSLIRSLTLAGALVSTISLAGATLAATPPRSTHASSTAVTQAAAGESDTDSDTDSDTGDSPTQDAHALAVSTAAASDLTGGPHDNHGGYVSCVARGGSDCSTATPTLPSHGNAASHSQAALHRG
jgi:hypothetical protein